MLDLHQLRESNSVFRCPAPYYLGRLAPADPVLSQSYRRCLFLVFAHDALEVLFNCYRHIYVTAHFKNSAFAHVLFELDVVDFLECQDLCRAHWHEGILRLRIGYGEYGAIEVRLFHLGCELIAFVQEAHLHKFFIWQDVEEEVFSDLNCLFFYECHTSNACFSI